LRNDSDEIHYMHMHGRMRIIAVVHK